MPMMIRRTAATAMTMPATAPFDRREDDEAEEVDEAGAAEAELAAPVVAADVPDGAVDAVPADVLAVAAPVVGSTVVYGFMASRVTNIALLLLQSQLK